MEKFKDCADNSTIEVQKIPAENTIAIGIYDDFEKINTSVFLDKEMAISFLKLLQSEIEKIV